MIDMINVKMELIGEVPIYIGFGVQTLMAILLGGLVGYDREKKLKAAGLKTHMLICLGSTIFTSMGILVAMMYGDEGDPNRMAAQIVSGIGFLGGGAIIRGQNNVIGLTSAATIWLVAAIGFTIGSGFPLTAAAFTLPVLLVLKYISPFYKFLEKESDQEYYQVEVLSRGSVKRGIFGIILNDGINIDEYFEEDYDVKKGKVIATVYLFAHLRQIERTSSKLNDLLKVDKVTYHSVVGKINQSMKAHEYIVDHPDSDEE